MNILKSVSIQQEKIIHSLDKNEEFYERYSEKVDKIIALNKEILNKKMFISTPGKYADPWIKQAEKDLENKRIQLDAHFLAFKCIQLILSDKYDNSRILKFMFDSGSLKIDMLSGSIAIRSFLKNKGSYLKYRDSYIKLDNMESDILNVIEKITPITKKAWVDLIKSDIAYFEKKTLNDCVDINHKNDIIKRI